MPASTSVAVERAPNPESIFCCGVVVAVVVVRLGEMQLEWDLRAVLPQSLEVVERALLRVLHVDHEVDVVQEDPTVLAVPLTTDRLVARGEQLLLHRVDDGPHLALVVG